MTADQERAVGLLVLVPAVLIALTGVKALNLSPADPSYWPACIGLFVAAVATEYVIVAGLFRRVAYLRGDRLLGQGIWARFYENALSPRHRFRMMIQLMLERAGNKVEPSNIFHWRMLHQDGTRTAIECYRRRADLVTMPDVRAVFQRMTGVADRGVIFTTLGFTQPAKEYAEGKPIRLMGNEELRQFYDKLTAAGLIGFSNVVRLKRGRRPLRGKAARSAEPAPIPLPEPEPEPVPVPVPMRPRMVEPVVLEAEPEPEERRCRYCGVLNAPQALFCKRCGAPF